MAKQRKQRDKTVTLTSPSGTRVTVTEAQAAKLRGYTRSKSAAKPSTA